VAEVHSAVVAKLGWLFREQPKSGMAYWQVITSQTVAATSPSGWTVLVPEAQRLDVNARSALTEVAVGNPYVLRLREFQLARPLMSMLAAGTTTRLSAAMTRRPESMMTTSSPGGHGGRTARRWDPTGCGRAVGRQWRIGS
jgi:hypothetical protein